MFSCTHTQVQYDRVVFRFFGLGNLKKIFTFHLCCFPKVISVHFCVFRTYFTLTIEKIAFSKCIKCWWRSVFFRGTVFTVTNNFLSDFETIFLFLKRWIFLAGLTEVSTASRVKHKLIRRAFSKLMKVNDVYLSLVQITGVSSWLNVYSILFCGLKIEGICCNMVVNGDLTVVFNLYLNGMKPKTLNFYSSFVSTKLFHLTSDQPSSKMRQALKVFLCKHYQNCFNFWV